MAATLIVSTKFHAMDVAGNDLAAGKVFTYSAGTLTPLATFTDQSGGSPNTNPVILDSTGRASIWLTPGVAYRIIVKDTNGVTMPDGDVDNITAPDVGFAAFVVQLATSIGSTLVGWIQAGAGAVLRTISDRLRDTVHVTDYMTAGQIADVRSGSLTLDVTAAVQAAHDALPAKGGTIRVLGACRLASTVTITKPVMFVGEGQAAVQPVTQTGFVTSNATSDMFQVGANGVTFRDLTFSASVTRTAGWMINFNSGTGNNNVHVRDCSFSNYLHGINFSGSGSGYSTVSNISLVTTTSGGIGIQYATTAPCVDAIVDNVNISGPVAGMSAGISLVNVGDITINRVSTVQCASGLQLIPGNGQAIQLAIVANSIFDSGVSYGIQSDPAAGGHVRLLKIINTWACTNAYGIILSPSNTGTTDRVEIVNCTTSNNVTGAGVYVGASPAVSNVLIQGGSSSQNADGVRVIAGANNVTINGIKCGPCGQFTGNTGYGINLTAGVSTNVSILGGTDVSGNTTGTIFDGSTGAGKIYRDIVGWGYASATFDPPNLAAAAISTTTITVAGAIQGDMATPSFSNALQGILLTAEISAANTATLRFQNQTVGALDLASGALRVVIERRT